MTWFALLSRICLLEQHYMVLVLRRSEFSLRNFRKGRSGFPSSIVVGICRKDLHDYEPRSQSRKRVNQSRDSTMSENGYDRLPPV
jgi:hypothetical protein